MSLHKIIPAGSPKKTETSSSPFSNTRVSPETKGDLLTDPPVNELTDPPIELLNSGLFSLLKRFSIRKSKKSIKIADRNDGKSEKTDISEKKKDRRGSNKIVPRDSIRSSYTPDHRSSLRSNYESDHRGSFQAYVEGGNVVAEKVEIFEKKKERRGSNKIGPRDSMQTNYISEGRNSLSQYFGSGNTLARKDSMQTNYISEGRNSMSQYFGSANTLAEEDSVGDLPESTNKNLRSRSSIQGKLRFPENSQKPFGGPSPSNKNNFHR